MKANHVRMGPGLDFQCGHCGDYQKMPDMMHLDVIAVAGKAYLRLHRKCPEGKPMDLKLRATP